MESVVDFKKRTDMHILRKIWHMSAVSLMILIYHLAPAAWSGLLLVGLWLVFVSLDFMRLRIPPLNDFVVQLFRPIIRQNEVKDLAGTTYLLSGVLLVYLFFPRTIVFLTLLYLAFADPIASYIGIKYGRDKLFAHKSLQGSMAAFFACMISTYFVLNYKGIMMDRILLISVLGGLIGAMAEALPLGKVDDNFSIPVVSAIFLWILFFIFDGLTGVPSI
jgi:diacylglycerol kinase (CTP)